jgi:hypothetical protein
MNNDYYKFKVKEFREGGLHGGATGFCGEVRGEK